MWQYRTFAGMARRKPSVWRSFSKRDSRRSPRHSYEGEANVHRRRARDSRRNTALTSCSFSSSIHDHAIARATRTCRIHPRAIWSASARPWARSASRRGLDREGPRCRSRSRPGRRQFAHPRSPHICQRIAQIHKVTRAIVNVKHTRKFSVVAILRIYSRDCKGDWIWDRRRSERSPIDKSDNINYSF